MKCCFFFWETYKLLNPSSKQSPVLVNNSNNNLSVHAKGGPISRLSSDRRLGGKGQTKWRSVLPCWCWKRKTFLDDQSHSILRARISIVCQFSSNCSTKLLPERGDWIGLNVNNEYYSNEKNYIFTGTRMNT